MINHRATALADCVLIETKIRGQEKSMEISCSWEQYCDGRRRYDDGELMQDAFPTLSADEREFLVTGLTPDEFEESVKRFEHAR